MNVLVACEESQRVCNAFRERGHNAFSCDIQPCSGGHPEWHIQGDAKEGKRIVETGTLPVLYDSPRTADDDRRER